MQNYHLRTRARRGAYHRAVGVKRYRTQLLVLVGNVELARKGQMYRPDLNALVGGNAGIILGAVNKARDIEIVVVVR